MGDTIKQLAYYTQELPALAWEDYYSGSARAPHDGGYFLVIPSGVTWAARYDRNGKTEWIHPVPLLTAGEAQVECEMRRYKKEGQG